MTVDPRLPKQRWIEGCSGSGLFCLLIGIMFIAFAFGLLLGAAGIALVWGVLFLVLGAILL